MLRLPKVVVLVPDPLEVQVELDVLLFEVLGFFLNLLDLLHLFDPLRLIILNFLNRLHQGRLVLVSAKLLVGLTAQGSMLNILAFSLSSGVGSYAHCCRFLRGSTSFTRLQALERSSYTLLVEAIAGAKRLHPLLPVKHVQLLDRPAVQHFHQLVHLRNAT